ncbi:MAG: DHA2 family efflux MFS transporter permease subunit [Chlamydiales bacterium]|nr:DHA2 family efflux MFS transporter permease subunit [Chlamydiales bacterium]
MAQKIPPFSLFIGFFCAIFFVLFSFTLPMMASPYIGGDLGGSNEITTYTTTFFCIGNALSIPLGEPISNKIGKTRLLLICFILFAFTTLLCAIASDYPMFLIFRIFQGASCGPLYVLVFYFISVLAPENRKIIFNSVLVTLFTVTPVIGACWGGWIAYDYNWRYVFYINTALILLLGIFLWLQLKDYEFPNIETGFNVPGYGFYVIGITSSVIALTMGQELDWFRSNLFIVLFITGCISLLFYILVDLYHPYPLLEFKLLKEPVFAFGLINLSILFSAYFGMVVLLSLWLNLYVNYTPIWISILVGTMAVAGIFPFFLVIEGFKRLDCRIPLGIAICLLAYSCFHTTLFNEYVNFGRIAISRIVAGFGLALFLPPIFHLCFRAFPAEKTAKVVCLFQVVRALSSGLGVAFYTTIWLRRRVFYHDRMGEKITPFSMETKQFFHQAEDFQLKGSAANEQLDYFLDRAATALALDDVFYLMTWILIGLLALLAVTFFFQKKHFYAERALHEK